MGIRGSLSLLAATALLTLAGCNVLSVVDKPSSEAQYLSAARACFDKGDLACARTNYEKVAGDSKDTAAAELVFTIFKEYNLDMGTFASTIVTSGPGGAALTALAEKLAPTTEAKRLAFHQALVKAITIQSKQLRGLARLLSAFAFAASVLAADVNTSDGKLKASYLVKDPTTCKASPLEICALVTACDKPSTSTLVASDRVALETATPSGAPTLGMVSGAIDQISTGFEELGIGGAFIETPDSFTGTLKKQASTSEPCFRLLLVKTNVGS